MDNTWVEISESALLHNLRGIKSLLSPATELMFVVKANGYGHGLRETASIAEKYPDIVHDYGVHLPEDGLFLRNSGIHKNIYILGYANATHIPFLVENDLIPVITNLELIPLFEKEARHQKKKVKITLKCETGTNRQGILFDDIPRYIQSLSNCASLELEGLSTHFANIEDTIDHSYAERQLMLFQKFIAAFKKAGFPLPKNHMACSAATLLFPETHFEMVRAGISSYGYWSSKETSLSFSGHPEKTLTLRPVLTWKTRIGQIKEVPPDSYIGYGCTFKTEYPTRLAILPVGYFDGYDRGISNTGYVLIHGKRAPLRGRVCMNMIIVDITHIPGCSLNDEVMLIGRSGNESISADTLASWTGTINYEILCRINPVIPRYMIS
jgi:alanine racemase